MTVLLGKTQRDLLNLDTLEKAFIWAVLSLRAACNNPDLANNPFSSNVQFTYNVTGDENSYSATVSGEIRLNYNQFEALASMADFIDNITNFTNISLDSPSAFSPTNPTQVIPQEQSYVTTLEKYLAWTAYILATSTLPSTNYIKINVFDDAEPPILRIQYSLPINYQAYLLTGNLVNSSIKLVNYYITTSNQTPANGAILPSPQFWKEPVNTITDLLALPSVIEGTQVFVKEVYSNFVFVDDLPEEADETDYFNASNQVNNEGWIRVNRSDLNNGGVTAWSQITGKQNFADVATTGSYTDLSNKPTIPTQTSQLTNNSGFLTSVNYPVTSVNGQTGNIVLDLSVNWSGVQEKPNFSTVAFTGNYEDLTNKPTITPGGSSSGSGIQEVPNNGNLAVNNWYWVNGTKSLTLPDWESSTDNDNIFLKIFPNTSITFLTSFDAVSFSTPGDYIICYKTSLKVWEIFSLFSTVVSATIKASEAVTEKVLLFTGSATTGQTTEDLFYWLGTNENTATWQHPNDRGKVSLTASTVLGGNAYSVIDRNLSTRLITDTLINSTLSIEFITSTFRLSQFRLSSQNGNLANIDPRQQRFRLEASNNNTNWDVLFTKNDDNWTNNWYLSPILNNTTSYKYYRFVSLGTITVQLGLQLVEVEFFGAWQL